MQVPFPAQRERGPRHQRPLGGRWQIKSHLPLAEDDKSSSLSHLWERVRVRVLQVSPCLRVSSPAMSPKPASAVPSPCVGICRMHGLTGWCEGCLRTIDEIAVWSQMSDGEKQAVWKQLPRRRSDPLHADA